MQRCSDAPFRHVNITHLELAMLQECSAEDLSLRIPSYLCVFVVK